VLLRSSGRGGSVGEKGARSPQPRHQKPRLVTATGNGGWCASQCSFRRSGVRGDRSVRGHTERSMCTRRTVGSGKHPGSRAVALLRGRATIRGSRSVAATRRKDSPSLTLGAPVTIGCTRGAEEGHSRNIQGARILRSVLRPTLLRPPVGGVARRHRGGWLGSYRGRQTFTGENGFGVCLSKARGARPVGLVPREGMSHHSAQNTKRVAVLVVLRGT